MVFVGSLGVCDNWEFKVLSLWSSVGSNMIILSIFTLGGFGCLTPFSLMWVSSSSWGGVWTRLALLPLFLNWHTLWKCPILWQSLHFAFLFWLVLWLSTSHALFFHPWGFSRLMTVIWRSVCSRIILSLVPPLAYFDLLLLPLFCLQSYAAKFMDEVESSWDRLLW